MLVQAGSLWAAIAGLSRREVCLFSHLINDVGAGVLSLQDTAWLHGRPSWSAVSELHVGAQEFYLEVQAATLAPHDELRNA
jgi:hypothetical protein